MTRRIITVFLTLLIVPTIAAATPPQQADIPEEALAAVATVDRFFAALSAGDLDRAAQDLDSEVLILENGSAERSAAEYLGHHAISDARFLKNARQLPGHRKARVSGNLAWVASDNDTVIDKDGKSVTIASTETMVLRRTANGWTIVHIHWSSHGRTQ